MSTSALLPNWIFVAKILTKEQKFFDASVQRQKSLVEAKREEYNRKRSFIVSKIYRSLTPYDEVQNHELPARREVRDDCGTIRKITTCKPEGHVHAEGNYCYKAGCPICYGKWASRLAAKTEKRFKGFEAELIKSNIIPPRWRAGLVRHFIISPPQSETKWFFENSTIGEVRAWFREIAKNIGIIGGCMIIHTWRKQYNSQGELERWRFSPHCHIIGYGFIEPDMVKYRGYVFKNRYFSSKSWKPYRRDVRKSIKYDLKHATTTYALVKRRKRNTDVVEEVETLQHTLTWFGIMAYNNFITEKMKIDKVKLCGVKRKDGSICENFVYQVLSCTFDGLEDKFFHHWENWMLTGNSLPKIKILRTGNVLWDQEEIYLLRFRTKKRKGKILEFALTTKYRYFVLFQNIISKLKWMSWLNSFLKSIRIF